MNDCVLRQKSHDTLILLSKEESDWRHLDRPDLCRSHDEDPAPASTGLEDQVSIDPAFLPNDFDHAIFGNLDAQSLI